MSNIQKALEALQPYVISIRYLKGVPVVDVVLTEGWTVPDNKLIKVVKGDDALNYFMLFSEEQGIGLDELLEYVDKIIKVNLEREKKHELLRSKVNELKEVFKKNNYTKLQRLKFTFGEEEEFMPSMSDLDIDDEPVTHEKNISSLQNIQQPIEEDIVEEPIIGPVVNPTTYLDEDGKPIEMTEEEKELAAEEARAERNLKILESRKQNQKPTNLAKKVELPPKRKVAMANTANYDTDCECGENEACEKCIDKKDF